MKKRTEFTDIFAYFVWIVSNEQNLTIVKIQSNNGKENISNKFYHFVQKLVFRRLFVPRNLQNNGRAERLNGTLENVLKIMLSQIKLCKNFWEDEIKTANYIYNITPKSSIDFKIPDELYYKKPMNIDKLRVFGYKAFYYILYRSILKRKQFLFK